LGTRCEYTILLQKERDKKYCIKGGEKCSNTIYISEEGERYFIGE